MDGIVDEFEMEESAFKVTDTHTPYSCIVKIKPYNNNSRGLYLNKFTKNNFFKPFVGNDPTELYFSVRAINGKRFLFIDEVQPNNTEVIKFLLRNPSRPANTHSAMRKISKTASKTKIVSVACQVIELIPEILTASKMKLIRIPIPGKPDYVRYQCILLCNTPTI